MEEKKMHYGYKEEIPAKLFGLGYISYRNDTYIKYKNDPMIL